MRLTTALLLHLLLVSVDAKKKSRKRRARSDDGDDEDELHGDIRKSLIVLLLIIASLKHSQHSSPQSHLASVVST